ncbi:MAG: hypothetical protein ACK56I_12325, partial [bacterium]
KRDSKSRSLGSNFWQEKTTKKISKTLFFRFNNFLFFVRFLKFLGKLQRILKIQHKISLLKLF